MYHYSIVFNSCCSKLRHNLLSCLLDGAHNGGLRSFCWQGNEREKKNIVGAKTLGKRTAKTFRWEQSPTLMGHLAWPFVTCNGVHRWAIQKNTYFPLEHLLRTIVPSNEPYHGRRLWNEVVLSMRHALLMMSDSRTLSKTAWLLSRRLTFDWRVV